MLRISNKLEFRPVPAWRRLKTFSPIGSGSRLADRIGLKRIYTVGRGRGGLSRFQKSHFRFCFPE